MKQVLAIVVILSFGVTTSTFAESPIEASAKRGAEEFAERFAQQNYAQSRGGGKALTWGGVALIGGGVASIILANTAAKNEQCVEFSESLGGFGTLSGSECVESTHKGLAWAGLAAAGLGVGLTVIGIRKNVQVGVSPTAVRVSVEF